MPYVRVKKRRKHSESAAALDWYKVGVRLLTVALTLAAAGLVIWMASCERPAPPPSDQETVGQARAVSR